ncbi:prephenate dehydrogenase, partial [bacterium]
MEQIKIKNVFIYGVGLIGGSIGISIKDKRLPYRVFGYSRSFKSRKKAVKYKAVDNIFDNSIEPSQIADIIVLCVPPRAVCQILENIFSHLKNNVIVTDVSSVKGDLYKDIQKIVLKNNKKYKKNVVYIGSHPMAGSEKKGVEHASGSILDK